MTGTGWKNHASVAEEACLGSGKTPSPSARTRHPPLLRIFCVWPPCRLERKGRKRLAGTYGSSESGHPPLPQALKANPGT